MTDEAPDSVIAAALGFSDFPDIDAAAALAALRDAGYDIVPTDTANCPYVVTDDDGTSYCRLAEAGRGERP